VNPSGTAQRIGVFGGAFDPPHNAHIALAEAALAQLDLAELHVVPTGQAWHKSRTLTSKEDRLAMARLAFGELKARSSSTAAKCCAMARLTPSTRCTSCRKSSLARNSF
jgi:cytidyltransferase-like protein